MLSELLCANGVIDKQLAQRLQAMVGFRNIVVRDYQTVNLLIRQDIFDKHLDDLEMFVDAVYHCTACKTLISDSIGDGIP
jgi:uncharacterized protein YutE (UPF0331/DUF86 family)